jgi:hypothetical protein
MVIPVTWKAVGEGHYPRPAQEKAQDCILKTRLEGLHLKFLFRDFRVSSDSGSLAVWENMGYVDSYYSAVLLSFTLNTDSYSAGGESSHCSALMELAA